MSLSGDTQKGKLNDSQSFAAELVSLKVDVIVTDFNSSHSSRKQATTTIPIVMTRGWRSRWHKDYSQPCAPRRQYHWVDQLSPELSGKRLELLKEAFPKVSRVAVFDFECARATRASMETWKLRPSARSQLQWLEVRVPEDLERAFERQQSVQTRRCHAQLLSFALDKSHGHES